MAEEAPVTEDELDELLGFQLRMAHLAMYRDFAASVGKLDLTQRQSAILFLIDANPGLSQAELAQRLEADRATIMGMVDRLAGRELISRVRSQTDRRRQELYLTREGQRLVTALRDEVAKHEKRFTKLFTPAQLAVLIQALERIQDEGR